MKSILALACLVGISTVTASGQVKGGGRTIPPPRSPLPAPSINTTIYLSGIVVIEDGGALTESVSIQTVCRGQKRTETHTDSHGHFSFEFGSRSMASTDTEIDAEAPSRNPMSGRNDRRNLQDCELTASLAGFRADVMQLGGRFSGEESADVGRIVLHRLANVDGFTVSATTAEAPGTAKKALEKGQDQQKKGKWDEAQKSFEKAVAIYPKFAVAWFELARVQLQKNDLPAARNSSAQSIAADPKYVNPYQLLTQLAVRERNWQEVIAVSDKVLSLNPVNFPDIWLSNAIGHYFLQNFSAAEKSARRGLQVDAEHRVPKLEYMLGMVLVQKPDYQEAAEHLRAFMKVSTKAADLAEAQKQLDEITRLSAAITTSEKK